MSIPANARLVYKICTELSQHMMIKEHISNARVRLIMHDGNLMNEEMIGHSGAKDLANQIRHLNPRQSLYDAVMAVLGVYVAHYFAEETIIFPILKTLKTDLKRSGSEILARKKMIRVESDAVKDVSDCPELIEKGTERNISCTKSISPPLLIFKGNHHGNKQTRQWHFQQH